MKQITLNQLAVKHPYYCSTSNYYSNDAATDCDNWKDFHEEYENLDIDMDLVFRWDIIKLDAEEQAEIGNKSGYTMRVFVIGQRKGLFIPNTIINITIINIFEDDVPSIISFLQLRYERIKSLWSPFNE